MDYDSSKDTLEHVNRVSQILNKMVEPKMVQIFNLIVALVWFFLYTVTKELAFLIISQIWLVGCLILD